LASLNALGIVVNDVKGCGTSIAFARKAHSH